MAIQVSGTEVISNARALTNVASIDATTAASITAAGVGGGLKLLQNYTTTSTASYFDIAFPSGYDWIRIAIANLKVTDTEYSGEFQARFLNSSGVISSNVYSYQSWQSGSPGAGLGSWMGLGMKALLTGAAAGNNAVLDIMNPRVSTVQTTMSYYSYGYGLFQTGYGEALFGKHENYLMATAGEITGIRILSEDAKVAKAGVIIKVWGAVNA